MSIKLCSAALYSTFEILRTDIKTIDILKNIVQDGGEVLVHNTKVITSTSIEQDYIDVFRDSKINFESAGLSPRGIILSGNGGGEAIKTAEQEKWSRKYYDYSDLYGTSKQYTMERVYTWGYPTVQSFKDKIDLCCAQKGFFPIALHGSEAISTIENLTIILNYIIAKGNSVAIIDNWSNTFDTYGTTVLEKRLSAHGI